VPAAPLLDLRRLTPRTGNGWPPCRAPRRRRFIEICHGTPFDEDAYVFDDLDALRAMHAARRPLCLFGHTHVQVGHYLSRDQFGLSTADDRRR